MANSKVSIELDLDIVSRVIGAKTESAVEDILRRYDLQRMIEAQLTDDSKPEKEATEVIVHGDTLRSFLFPWVEHGKKQPLHNREILEAQISAAISAAIEAKIKQTLEANVDKINAAVEKMITPERLTGMLIGMLHEAKVSVELNSSEAEIELE